MVKVQVVFTESVVYNLPMSEWVWTLRVVMAGSGSCFVMHMHETGDILDVSTALKLCLMRHEVLRFAYVLVALDIG
jgi:hypothetical protein